MLVMRYLSIVLLGLAALAQEAEERALFRAGVSVVRVDAQVIDGKRVVSGLTAGDFEVRDNGIVQPLEYFGRETEPLWLVMLVDVSGSMTRYVSDVAATASQALDLLRPEDRVAVMVFGRETRVLGEFTGDLEEAALALRRARDEDALAGGSVLNSAVREAADYLREAAEGKPGRRAIVILTDNGGLNYQEPTDGVVDALHAADAVLNALVTPDARPPKPLPPGLQRNPDFDPSDVFRLAYESGGEVLKAARAGQGLRDMIERVRTRYSLHYRAPQAAPGERRRIEVSLAGEAASRYRKAQVRARTGYRAPE
jgi:VWFA-related protein